MTAATRAAASPTPHSTHAPDRSVGGAARTRRRRGRGLQALHSGPRDERTASLMQRPRAGEQGGGRLTPRSQHVDRLTTDRADRAIFARESYDKIHA
ncbi:MAG: hypothetical protein QM630_09115 [Microbacterium sp.]